MKHFFKLSSIPLLFVLGMSSQIIIGGAVSAPAMSSAPQAMSGNGGQAGGVPSVHEMFKDVPQDELLKMMEEGQQFIKYLEENGTPEEKMAFAQAMEETLQGFTEDDWKEFEAIVETVQDKLPPLVIDEPVQAPIVETIKEEIKKEETKPVVVDNSLEKILHAIHKAINSLLLKAKSDKILTERITISWENKDQFNEMSRLLQVLNKKDHIIKLTTSKDEAIQSLLESIQNFNKRLQIENDKFVIADTFGLQADEQTTAANLKKLNKILEFFDNAIESLLPKLMKFIEEYEPEALKKAKEHDDSAKKALEHANKVEKQQKRPANNSQYQDRSGSQKNKNQSQGGYNPGYQGGQSASREITPSYMEKAHRENIKNIPSSKKSGSQGGAGSSDKAEDKNKKENKNNQYDAAIDNLNSYLESNANAEVGTYMATINKAQNIYSPFGTPINEDDRDKAERITEKQSRSGELDGQELRFLEKHSQLVQAAEQNFAKNTLAAHTYYDGLSESISNIAPQIDEMMPVMQTIKASLAQMNSKELEKLLHAPTFKNFGERIKKYHTTFKNVQSELRNKHRLHALKRSHGQAYSSEERAYDELASKVTSLHGLDKKIDDAKSKFDSLHKAIKSSVAKRKREENKKDKN